MLMKTLPSREVQNNFGQVANMVIGGEEIVVTQYNRPTLMIIPYEIGKEAMRLYRAEQMVRFMKNMETNKEAEELTMEDINRLVHESR
jgi:antitoxin (DNA-binding transcriptional repressor) of toxin-antitoxin stability system